MDNISPMLFPPRAADAIKLWTNNDPFRFHLVCRHWYKVALSIPSLWSHIYSRTFRPPSTMGRCPPPAPLHLNAIFRTGSVGWDAHWGRLVSLHMILKPRIQTPGELLEMMRPAPLLESLSIENLTIYDYQKWSHPWFGLKQYRNLRRLRLDCSHLPREELEEIRSLTNLTHLFLEKIKAEDIFPILSGFINSPFLEVLILEARYIGAAHDFSSAPVVCLPVLRHLETYYIRHLTFIDHLDIPSTTTIIATLRSIEAPLPRARLDAVQTLDVKFIAQNRMSLCFLSDTSVMVESDKRRHVLLPLLSKWFPNFKTLDLRLVHNSVNGDSEGRLMRGIIGWTGLRRLVFNKFVDYFRLISILNISDTRSSDMDIDNYGEDKLAKTLNDKASICPVLQEVVVWELPPDFESEYEGVKGRWKYRKPGRYEIVRPQPALAYTLDVRAQTHGIPRRPTFKWIETDRY